MEYINERAVRRFTKAVYEGSNAQHTYDGKLGYILLVGDVDAGNTGMPTSYDHTYSAANNTSDITPSDYYFTCVTAENGGYDEIGDLFIGRFSVDNNASGVTGLHNVVEKTIKNETEFSPNWKNNVHAFNGTAPHEEYYVEHYHPYVDFITQSQDYDFVNYFAYSNNTDLQNAFKQMTDNGAATLIYSGHGGVETWEGAINNTYITNNLNNTLKSPFAASLACLTGYFDHSTQKCMGEKLTTYSPDKGFVGFLGAGRVTWGTYSYPIHYPPFIPYKLQTSIPYSIYYDLSFITGEFILESKVRSNSLHKFGYNYFGDPALNIMAQGYEITQDLTLNSSTDISSDITVKNNSMVAFNNNLSLHNGANFIIESGSSVELSSNTFVSAEPQSMFTVEGVLRLTNQQLENLTVEVKNGGKLIIDDAVTFHATTNLIVQQGGVIEAANGSSELIICGNVSLSSGVKIANFTQNNTGGIIYKGTGAFDLVQSDIQNTRITAFFRNGRPQIEDCNFTNSPLYLIGGETNSCSIENNRFSGAEGAAALKVEGFPTYTISNNVFSNNESHAISLYNAGSTTYRQYVISNNIIHHNSDLRSAKGIVLYASVADIRDNVIYSNDFGLGLYHNSSVRMWGDPEKASQQVYGNKYNQLLSADNSFPWYFKWNIIQDAGNPNYVIYCRDVKNLRYDVRNNCWGEKFNPDEDFYPAPSFTWSPVWDCGINADGSSTGSAPRVAYETSLEQIANEDYAAAETQLQLIVETWPDSKYAATALKTMPDVAVKRNNIDQLINYFNTNATIQADEELKKLAGYLSADCDVIKANYQQALDFYAGIIDNPPTVEDSIYAQIDAGRVHFLMEQEGNKAPVAFKYQHIIPKSHAAYSLKRKQLLDEISGEIKPQTNELQTDANLNQQAFVDAINIYPNPVFDELNVELFSKTEGAATFSIYSSTGRCIYTSREELTNGKGNSYVVETKGFAQGVYLLQVTIDGSQVYSRRFIINR